MRYEFGKQIEIRKVASWGCLSCSRCCIGDTSSINPSFWHLHDDEIRHALLPGICYYFVVSRTVGNRALIILRERNPSI